MLHTVRSVAKELERGLEGSELHNHYQFMHYVLLSNSWYKCSFPRPLLGAYIIHSFIRSYLSYRSSPHSTNLRRLRSLRHTRPPPNLNFLSHFAHKLLQLSLRIWRKSQDWLLLCQAFCAMRPL
jgi:hypothetical protein